MYSMETMFHDPLDFELIGHDAADFCESCTYRPPKYHKQRAAVAAFVRILDRVIEQEDLRLEAARRSDAGPSHGMARHWENAFAGVMRTFSGLLVARPEANR
jgi:hypothetical protein